MAVIVGEQQIEASFDLEAERAERRTGGDGLDASRRPILEKSGVGRQLQLRG